MRARLRLPRLRLVLVGLLGLGLALTLVTGSAPRPDEDVREIADMAQFNPGNIITDGVFYDTSTMDAGKIQAFLDAQDGRCTSNCLSGYRENTQNRAADPRCAGYTGAPNESAATIIYKVARSCGINPQVILVMLQKEQGLVTGTPSGNAYRSAMGFGCPDTAACDSLYYGFSNQVYSAANQLQRYRQNPGNYKYRAGITNSIGYQVAPSRPEDSQKFNYLDRDCGRASIYIQNQATAALYIYTPYTPNAAALANPYGLGDSCSAYGNRNFFRYFVDWFGSTQTSGGAAVLDKYDQLKASGVDLGAPISETDCGLPGGGCWRNYQGGAILWSKATGAHSVRGAILAKYLSMGGTFALGYPTNDDTAAAFGTGFYNDFQGGAIYWSPSTDTHLVRGAILDMWRSLGAQAGVLGYPTADDEGVPGGFRTRFSGGTIYWSEATGARVIRGALLQKYEAFGGPAKLGFPTVHDGATSSGDGAYVDLQGGSLYWTEATGAHVVRGAVLTTWRQLGAQSGPMGYPTGDDTAVAGGFETRFVNGTLYWSQATGARGVRGALDARYRAAGGPAALGFPTMHDGPTRTGSGAYVDLQGGAIYWSQATGAHVVRGAILTTFRQLNAEGGPMGFPTGDDTAVAGGNETTFANGTIYWSQATGARGVRGALDQKYRALGGPAALGFPTMHDGPTRTGGGAYVDLQGGSLYWSQATGAHVVRGAILATWRELGLEGGPMGFPTGDDTAVAGGYETTFANGTVYWSQATGARGVRGALDARYRAAGGPAALGFPTMHDGPTSSRDGAYVDLQRGSIYWSQATGAHVVAGDVLTRWRQLGAQGGSLGYPTGDDTVVGSGRSTAFSNGSIYWSAATGARVVMAPAAATYAQMGGPASALGFPTADTRTVPEGRRTDFQGGYLLAAADGTVTTHTG
ncbi:MULTISPECIES: hypothetical protein [unclassified Blastococcus]